MYRAFYWNLSRKRESRGLTFPVNFNKRIWFKGVEKRPHFKVLY